PNDLRPAQVLEDKWRRPSAPRWRPLSIRSDAALPTIASRSRSSFVERATTESLSRIDIPSRTEKRRTERESSFDSSESSSRCCVIVDQSSISPERHPHGSQRRDPPAGVRTRRRSSGGGLVRAHDREQEPSPQEHAAADPQRDLYLRAILDRRDGSA